MDFDTMDALKNAGVDLDGTLKRFSGNTELFERFLMKFPKDKTFEELTNTLENGDVKAAFAAAHTLKGVAANLGINSVRQAATGMMELLRNEKLEEARAMYSELNEAYQVICRILAQEQ